MTTARGVAREEERPVACQGSQPLPFTPFAFRAAVLVVLLAGPVALAQNSSLFRKESAVAAVPGEGSAEARVVTPAMSLIVSEKPKPLTFAKHDFVTVVIREQASQATKGNVKTSRDSSIDGSVDALSHVDWASLSLRPDSFGKGNPAIKAEMKREFDGSGNASRTDSLTARIEAEIIDIKPNGNLVLQASKVVQTDEESYTITVTGSCKTKDITPDNSILSTQIAELKIVKTSTGAVKDATKRGVFHKFLDWINLF